VTLDDYVYFYARFGPAGESGDQADSGFEEWRIDTGNYEKVEPFDVPEPHEYACLAVWGCLASESSVACGGNPTTNSRFVWHWGRLTAGPIFLPVKAYDCASMNHPAWW